jgi:histidinol phosphatase-like PHP family hydrolase
VINDFHTHTIFSDGELVPAELIRRAVFSGINILAITDHADFSNIEFNLSNIIKVCDKINSLNKNSSKKFTVLPGVEITHVPPSLIKEAVNLARKCGALIVIVHGETFVEPVEKGTNLAALKEDIDILAHPGLITEEEALLAKNNNIYLELSCRKGHCLANGHVVNIAKKIGSKLIISSDAHGPEDIFDEISYDRIAFGAGLNKNELDQIKTNTLEIVNKLSK